jgi:RNA polymerase sigma-70 factor (ECF subfamily)
VREPDPVTIRRAQGGDLAAFERLVRECQADAWRFAYHLTHDRATADDVTQDAFLRAFRNLRSYRGQSKFSSWLLRIVRNCAIDAYHRVARQRRLVEEVGGRTTPERGPDVEERLRVQQAVRALPDWLREPFVLIEVLGYTYQETATILALRVGTVKSRMHRARASLVLALSEEAADEM